MLTRRKFLKTGAALTAIGVLPAGLSNCTPSYPKGKNIGLQLYSVMDILNTDFDGTIKTLIDIGIKRFESFGYRDGKFFGKTPSEMKTYLANLGAQITSAHSGMRFLDADDADNIEQWDAWKKNCSDTAEVGSSWIIQAGYPTRQIQSVSDVFRLADQFNKCGEVAKSYNLQFAFHNHLDELHELEGQIPYDILLQNTDQNLVAYQIDTGYMQTAFGSDFLNYIKKYSGRFQSLHLRDVDSTGEGTPLGKGVTNFEALFALVDTAGVKEYYIEHGQASLEDMKNNYNFLMNAPYVKA